VDLIRRKPDTIHARLKAAIEIETTAHLWTPSGAITFTPYLMNTIYGDGRALFYVGTINQRPRYWVIRGDSGWDCGNDYPGREDDEFYIGEFIEEIITHLEEELGTARCGYCGQSLSMYSPEEWREANPPVCDQEGCEAQEDLDAGCAWPAVDDNGGCHWGRKKWPEGFEATSHPLDWRSNLLDEPIALQEATRDECTHLIYAAMLAWLEVIKSDHAKGIQPDLDLHQLGAIDRWARWEHAYRD
jgi:hypothetical protein